MNKQLKLLQRSKVLKTLEVEKVKHDLSKIKNSTIVMVAYDDATDKFLIGDNSGDLYVATSEYLKSLDIKNSSIDSIINGMTKSSIAQHFNKISLQEAKEMFGKKYLYYWSANNKIYGVKRGIIERLDNGPDNTSVVELWSRTENVLSNDRGVTGLKEVKFSSDLRPAFLTFNKDAIPTYTRDNYLTVRDPVKVADIMNNELQNHDYVPKDDKYGYDMKDSNAVMKAYLGTDDLVILSNIDKRKVIDIDPPNTDPDNPDVEYNNNTPFNHNYNMVWSTIRSARLFEEFNDEANDNNSNFVNMTRHERSELTNFILNNHVDAAGLYANIPNLADTYTTYINGKDFGDKQIYSSGIVAVSIKNDFKWSLDRIDGDTCTITKRVYNSVTGEVTNAQRTYDGVVEFEIVNIKDNTTRIRKIFKIPSLNNTVCDFDKFEYKHDSTGNAISLPIPEEYENGIIEYKLDTTKFVQGTNGKISYGLREIYIQSGATKYLIDSTNSTGTATFSVYTLAANATSATIKRNTEIIFKNTDGTNYSYKTINNGIGTGSVEHLVANTPTGVSNNNHISRHTRNVHYMSGSTDVVCKTDYSDPNVNYKIYTLNAGATTATLKGSSTGVFKTVVNGSETNTTYNVVENDHITVTSNTITYTRNTETYTSASDIKCSQTMNVDYTYGGVTIRKTITKSAAVIHSIYTLSANATSATIKRVFTPVFYTISAGIESSSIIYKNDTIIIDTNKTATVSHTVSSSVTSASGSNHYTTHTRTVTYTQNDVSVNVNTAKYTTAAITYKIWTLEANVSTATLKGSSTGIFKTISNGSETSTTYNVAKTDHITVTGNVSHTACDEITTSNYTNYTTHTRTVTYTQNNVTVTVNTVNYTTTDITYKIWTLGANATTATLKASSTGVFKTIVDGYETDTTYNVVKNDHITVQGDVSYTARDEITSASGSTHYTTHARIVNYRYERIDYTSVDAPITYKIIDLDGPNYYSIPVKGSSTGTFKTISNGSETDTTYNVVKNDHIILNGAKISYTASDHVTSASGSDHYTTYTRTVTYTNNDYPDVTVTVNTATCDTAKVKYYNIYTLNAGSTTATLKGSSTGTFKIIVDGSETDTTYNVNMYDHITVTGDVSLSDIIDSYKYGSKEAHIRLTAKYTFNNVTKTVTINSARGKITLTPKNINERENTVKFGRSYSAVIHCINNFNSISTYYFSGSRSLPDVTGSITQTLDVGISHANYYEFKTVIEDDTDDTLVNTNSMNITQRLGNVSLKQAASMLLNNTDNAKNKVYIGDYFKLGGYTWQNNSGTTFTAGTAKYTLVERTSDNHLIFMSSERHKLTSETSKALSWKQLITENKLETILLPQLESILGITPVSYTRKSDIPHLTNKKVFLPTEYEIFGKYDFQKENERYSGERQWEIFRTDKEERRRYFRRDVNTGDINTYAPSNSDNGWGYWLATNSIRSGYASLVLNPGSSDCGYASRYSVTDVPVGVRPCFML